MTDKKSQNPKNTRPTMDDSSGIGSGVFSNVVNVFTNQKEVFLDFGMAYPSDPAKQTMSVQLVSRVVLSREHASEFVKVLDGVLKQNG